MIKVVIIGPESTGKSTLCKLLAAHYQTLFCPEYARDYLMKHGTAYTYEDLLTIAKGQVAAEEDYIREVASSNQKVVSPIEKTILFIDTDMYVMKVWCEFVFGKCHSYILEQIAKRKYDLYLLCNIDLPWEKDELREYPDLDTRAELYGIYKDLLLKQDTRWVDISGDYNQRLQSAVKAVDGIR